MDIKLQSKIIDLFPPNLIWNSLQCFSEISKALTHGCSQVKRRDTDQLQCFCRLLQQNKHCHLTETQHKPRTLLLTWEDICPLSESSNYRVPKVVLLLTATIYLTFPGNITNNSLCNSSTGAVTMCIYLLIHTYICMSYSCFILLFYI